MKIKSGFVLRNVANEIVVVPVGEMSKQFHGMITLNESGAFMWNFLKNEHTIEECIRALRAEYDVDEQTAKADVEQFTAFLAEKKFIE